MTTTNPTDLDRDLRTLALFIRFYCRQKHPDQPTRTVHLKTHNVEEIAGAPVTLCPACEKLLTHAFVKRSNCPMDPKPTCKHCPKHCYHPTYRAQIRQVMKYSGMQMVLRGRLDYLVHLLF